MICNFQSAQLIFDQESLDLLPNKTSSGEALYVDFTSADEANHKRFQIFIHPKKEVVLKKLELRFSVPLTQNSSVFCNGFLSNHSSRTYLLSDKLSRSGWLTAKVPFQQQAPTFETKGSFHSWHYGYVGTEKKGLFLGSLNETTAFTRIEYDTKNQQIIIRKDIANLRLGHSFPLLDLMVLTGKKESCFATYFSAIEAKKLEAPPITGWMASKHHNGNSAAAITDFLARQVKENIPADLVLIGSGYAKEVGDWLYSNDQFPDGLPPIISEIKSAGLKVGMSLAPLLCSAGSDIYRQHADWVLRDEQNNPVTLKTELGNHYVLDAYNAGVQDYLQVFCYTVTTQWGIDLLKFDHLSTAFGMARKTKTRAQASNDFLKMLRSSCPESLIWATDLPMSIGCLYANYTSTASNVLEDWNTRFPLLYANPNGATASVQLKNIIHRFNYSQYGTGGNLISLATSKELTETQQHTVLFINALFSDISVIVDAPKTLSAEAWSEWRLADQLKAAKVTKIIFSQEDACIIEFKHNDGKSFRALINLGNKEISLEGVSLLSGETLIFAKKKNG